MRRDIQMVFQDPLSSLSPWQRIGALLEEPLRIQGEKDGEKRRDKVLSILEKVGLSQEHYFRYPHELSGGQRAAHGHCPGADHRAQTDRVR